MKYKIRTDTQYPTTETTPRHLQSVRDPTLPRTPYPLQRPSVGLLRRTPAPRSPTPARSGLASFCKQPPARPCASPHCCRRTSAAAPPPPHHPRLVSPPAPQSDPAPPLPHFRTQFRWSPGGSLLLTTSLIVCTSSGDTCGTKFVVESPLKRGCV